MFSQEVLVKLLVEAPIMWGFNQGPRILLNLLMYLLASSVTWAQEAYYTELLITWQLASPGVNNPRGTEAES